VLLKNLGAGKYVDVGMALGADEMRDARGVAVSDFDADGDLDLIINHNPGVKEEYKNGIRPTLLRNDVPIGRDGTQGKNRNWLAVQLTGGAGQDSKFANQDAVGAEVHITLEDKEKMMRHVVVGSSYASQRSKQLHFGLGAHESVAKLVVHWKRPAGAKTELTNIPANQLIKIDQLPKKKPFAGAD